MIHGAFREEDYEKSTVKNGLNKKNIQMKYESVVDTFLLKYTSYAGRRVYMILHNELNMYNVDVRVGHCTKFFFNPAQGIRYAHKVVAVVVEASLFII